MPYFADKYAVLRILGRGGMGTIFEARHVRLGHRVAIKVLGEELRAHPELVKRFEREARAAGSLSSPRAVKIYDIDQTEDGTPYMVMELLHGRDLAHLVEDEGPQPIGAAARFIVEACDAIAEAHQLGIVHRDIKPSNLFLCAETGSVKVLDFGIAKRVASKEAAITSGVAPLGTPQYMSPEQVRCAGDIDARTDIWSLGVTLYELVCGRPPFNHEIPQACIAAIVVDPIPDPRTFRPDLPEELVTVIMRALSKDVAERYATIAELVAALEPFADASAPLAEATGRSGSVRRLVIAREDTTLGGGDIFDGSDWGGGDSRGELTVPPAVSPTRSGVRKKRIRSSVFAGAAVVAALAGIVVLPRAGGLRVDARAKGAPAPTAITAVVSASLLPGENAANANPAAVGNDVVETAPPPVVEGPGLTAIESVVVGVAPAQSTAAPAKPKVAPKPLVRVQQAPPPVRLAGTDRAVHGGLSSPGF